jgi:hypothetical protein
MGYGIKYHCEFDSTKGVDYKVLILQKDYNSAIMPLRMGGNPVQINYTSSSENKFEIIRGSECILNFYSEYDSQFEEIMIADKNEFLIQVWKNDSLHWQGYVIQDNYAEPFLAAPYLISLRATDGLGDLKLMDYADKNGNIYLQDLTFAEAILNCLRTLQNATQLVTSNDVFESRIDRLNTSNESFNQLTVNSFIFLKSELNAMKCDEVLKMILDLFQCYIYYKKGKYYIERISYKLSESLIRRTYNINFNGDQEISNVVSTESIRSQISRGGALRFINGDQSISYVPAFNKVVSNSDVVDPANLVANNYFRFWNSDSTLPYNWLKSGTLDIVKKNYSRSGSALQINTKAEDNQISFSTNQLKPTRTAFQGALTEADSLSIKLASIGNVRFMVKCTTPVTTYYLKCSGYTESQELKYDAWFAPSGQTGFCKVRQAAGGRASSGEDGSFFITELSAKIPEGTTSLDIAFMPSFIDQYYNDPCVIREFTPKITAGVSARSMGDQYSITSTKNVRESYEEFNPDLGEFNVLGATNQILLVMPTGKTTTQSWFRAGRTESKSLFEISMHSILNQYRTPFKLFTGSIYGEFDYGKVFNIENLNGLFMPYQVTSDLKFDTSNVSFFELLSDTDAESDKFTRLKNYKDGEYNTRTNAVSGGVGVPRPAGGSSGGGRAGRG